MIFECKEGPFSRLASSNERPKVERVEHEVDGNTYGSWLMVHGSRSKSGEWLIVHG